jgi:hypothetical protein
MSNVKFQIADLLVLKNAKGASVLRCCGAAVLQFDVTVNDN